jgi:hypothetical protein
MGRKEKKTPREKAAAGNAELGWNFPSTGGGEEHGFADSQLEHFQGDHEKYIAREAIQNAVDARLDNSMPVKVVFEKLDVPVKSLPGNGEMLDRLKRCVKFVAKQPKAEEFFGQAIDLLEGKSLSVLKISDYNTNGLTGSDDDRDGNWYRLVKATGTSSPKGVAGGSFGIGKGAPIAASSLRTVFYSSVNELGESVFQGKARLVSHYDDEHDVRQGVGFYGIKGFRSVRDPGLIPPFFKRDERGTDIFVVGYSAGKEWKEKLIKSVLENFWLAILHGDLEVVIKDDAEMTITKDNLKACLEEYDAEDARNYYEAATNWSQKFEVDLKHLGKVTLSVRKQDGFPSKIMMARQPKMMVQEKAYRVLREPFSGVLLCADDRGNTLLRDLEPPAHDKWDKDRAKNGWAALTELDAFIKEKLKSMGESVTSEPQDIPGLDRYLPDSEERETAVERSAEAYEPTETTDIEETGREVGKTMEPAVADVEPVLRRASVVRTPASGEGEGKKRKKGKGGVKGTPSGKGGQKEGEGPSELIRTGDLTFRSFAQRAKSGIEYRLIITALEDCNGSVRIAAVGDDGSYPVNVVSAIDLSSNAPYEVEGSLIKNLKIDAGKTVKLAVKLDTERKYALGIESYEG